MTNHKVFYLGTDHGGLSLRDPVITAAQEAGYEIVDFGTTTSDSVDYPLYAEKVCQAMKEKPGMGVLLCGTGIGVSIAANRFAHIRAALCHLPLEAQVARQHNNANILCLGGRILSPETAQELTRLFLQTDFEGGRHQRRIDQIEDFSC